MPNGHDADPVSYGRWQEAHARLEDRVTELRQDFDAYARATNEALARRRDRQWTLLIAVLTGLALPLLVVAIVSLVTAIRLH